VRDAGRLAAMAGPGDIRMHVRPTEMIVDEQAFQVDTEDAFVGQEVLETAYHELWELVHVFFEHEGLLLSGDPAADACLPCGDVARSVVVKWEEVAALRRATSLDAVEEALTATLRPRVQAGGTVLAFGNGGSATDAADLVADLQAIGVPALDLSGEPSVITAIGNDIGFEEVFARQVIALGRPGDVAVGITTSGRSANALRALRQARRQGLATIALAG